MRRTVQDVMTRSVVVAHPSTPFKELVRLLNEHRVTALPVVDETGRVLGVVSESDLVLKETQPVGPMRDLPPQGTPTVERAKAAGTRAWEVMTAPAVTTHPEVPVASAARLMADCHVSACP